MVNIIRKLYILIMIMIDDAKLYYISIHYYLFNFLLLSYFFSHLFILYKIRKRKQIVMHAEQLEHHKHEVEHLLKETELRIRALV